MTRYLGKCKVPTLRGYILEIKGCVFQHLFKGITQCTNLPKIYFHFVSWYLSGITRQNEKKRWPFGKEKCLHKSTFQKVAWLDNGQLHDNYYECCSIKMTMIIIHIYLKNVFLFIVGIKFCICQ